ncbi:unnamed protein product [Lathyrus sativus]|nr:unnamed protein product [Lathyrus sativus]
MIKWRIGDGSKIKVMSDPWLRGVGKVWANAPQNRDAYNISVKDLMLNSVKIWDKYKIKHLFTRDVAKAILEVPLLEEVGEDGLVWKEEQSGIYSVKIGYKILKGELRERKDLNVEGE